MPEVRASFNSPFWPFVLVSTSVGQEGIDFHWWCHALLHWNVPPNPVDFEQREGRIDRFRGHAIRKNVALKHGASALNSEAATPWRALFEMATDLRDVHGHFTPDWVYPGPAKIQRHIFPFTLSKDEAVYEKVSRDVALYRLALGQPRQEDMVAFVRNQGDDAEPPARINLIPPRGARRESPQIPPDESSTVHLSSRSVTHISSTGVVDFAHVTKSDVHRALAEYDSLGKEEFLRAHGFGRVVATPSSMTARSMSRRPSWALRTSTPRGLLPRAISSVAAEMGRPRFSRQWDSM